MSPTVHSFKSLKTSPEEQTATEMTALTVRSPAAGQGCRCPPCQQFRSPTVLRIGCLIFVGRVTCHVAQLIEGGHGQAWPELTQVGAGDSCMLCASAGVPCRGPLGFHGLRGLSCVTCLVGAVPTSEEPALLNFLQKQIFLLKEKVQIKTHIFSAHYEVCGQVTRKL